MKDLNDMMVFLLVVEHGGFTAAAEAIDLPKSNISRKVSRLEQSLGVRLLERSTRRQHLTEIGEIYYQHCLRINEEMKSAQLSVQHMMSKPVGKLRICASIGVGQGLLSLVMADFRRLYPDVSVDLQLTNRRVDIIEEGFDLAIRVGEMADSNLIAKHLFRCNRYLYASPNYFKHSDKPLPQLPGQLNEYDCLYMNAVKRKPQWALIGPEGAQTINIDPAFSCDDFGVLRQLALDDGGIADLPDYMAEQEIQRGNLIRVLPQWGCGPVNIYGVYPSNKGATPKVRALLDYLFELDGV